MLAGSSEGLLCSLAEARGLVHGGLPVPVQDGAPLYGAFLAGAYQESLGASHNLFGEADEVVVDGEEVRVVRLGRRTLEMSGCGGTAVDGELAEALRALGEESTYPMYE